MYATSRIARKTTNSTNPNHSSLVLVVDLGIVRVAGLHPPGRAGLQGVRRVDEVACGTLFAGDPCETPDSNGIVRARVRRDGRVANAKLKKIMDAGIASAKSP